MTECEYRQGSDSLVITEKYNPLGAVAVSFAGGSIMICKIKANLGESGPICELLDYGSGDGPKKCPIADYAEGRLTIEETNRQLTKIFESRKK